MPDDLTARAEHDDSSSFATDLPHRLAAPSGRLAGGSKSDTLPRAARWASRPGLSPYFNSHSMMAGMCNLRQA
ncbi:protein of unknown function (plasmid) [Methylocella tundrae]|uniref:Uncharacterized protein n=1 Tax=Methylocella tundrae TaxID=227605 RepID=A0A4V6IN57_METTU|nr:protein of unknown function [Methylocella tundrae]